jgi:hypothetical protein
MDDDLQVADILSVLFTQLLRAFSNQFLPSSLVMKWSSIFLSGFYLDVEFSYRTI